MKMKTGILHRLVSLVLGLAALVVVPSLASANEAVETMRSFYKIADSRPFQPEKLAAMVAEDFVDYDAVHKNAPPKDAMLGLFSSLANGAPDSVHNITFMEPVGSNKALIRWRFTGTHTGNLLGMPVSGKGFDIAGLELWEIRDGKVVSLYHVEEIANLLGQLGMTK